MYTLYLAFLGHIPNKWTHNSLIKESYKIRLSALQKLVDIGITHHKILGHLTAVTAPTERHCRSDIALSKCSIIFLFKLNPSSKKPRFFFRCQKQLNLRWRFTDKIWRPINCITARHVTIIVWTLHESFIIFFFYNTLCIYDYTEAYL